MVIISRREVINGMACTRKVRSSKNLRGVVEHNRVHGKPVAHIADTMDGGAYVGLEWPNGDTSCVRFASSYVANCWFKKRASSITRQLVTQ